MKTQFYFQKSFLALALSSLILTACEPKNEPRWEHQSAPPTFVAAVTPQDNSVEEDAFLAQNLEGAESQVKSQAHDLTVSVLLPLSKFVLNAKFIAVPKYRTIRMTRMIGVFNEALLLELQRGNRSAEFLRIKENYYKAVFAGCSRDLRADCVNATVFAADGRHTRIMTLLASELDTELEGMIRLSGSGDKCLTENPRCRYLIEERYFRLAMGLRKSNSNSDTDFSFAYLKYARLFAIFLERDKAANPLGKAGSMTSSYLAEMHGKIFETIIAHYTPASVSDPEFKLFVENFNPWGYSRFKNDIFQHGTGVMFSLGSQCCLYTSSAKTEISPSLKRMIEETQTSKEALDSFGPSLRQMVAKIREQHGDRIFKNLGVTDLARRIEQPNGAFYNEFFYIVDRLFRGHLTSQEIELMLQHTNEKRAAIEFPQMVTDYLRIQTLYLLVETNRVMAEIYKSNVSSEQLYIEAQTRSRQMTPRWGALQAQTDLLDRLLNSYFKSRFITSDAYTEAVRQLNGINRNIHYLSVFPQMLIMNFYLAQTKGVIKLGEVDGKPILKPAEEVLKAFFDGIIKDPWYAFGKNPETLEKPFILFALEYLLSTEGIQSVVVAGVESGEASRANFFNLIFTKYLDESSRSVSYRLTEYEHKFEGNPDFANAKAICDYELGSGGGLPQHVKIDFQALQNYTYTGNSEVGVNMALSNYLAGGGLAFDNLLREVNERKTFAKAMMDVVENDLLRNGKIAARGAPHPDLEGARKIIQDLNDLQRRAINSYAETHKRLFKCSLKLREVERRRANRIFEEERAYLGQVFDLMKPLLEIKDEKALDEKVKALNDQHFKRGSDSPFKFDRIDGLNYRMSKYDLYIRIKNWIDKDIFIKPTAREIEVYGKTLNEYLKPRAVSVDVPEGVVRDDMVASETSTNITINGSSPQDRENFIRSGMALLGGRSGSYINWYAQPPKDEADKYKEQNTKYLVSLLYAYLLPNVDGQNAISAADVVSAYIDSVSSYFSDPFDVYYASLFQNSGRYDKAFFRGMLFEKDGSTRLPLFYHLMEMAVRVAALNLERADSRPDEFSIVGQAVDFARQFISIQPF